MKAPHSSSGYSIVLDMRVTWFIVQWKRLIKKSFLCRRCHHRHHHRLMQRIVDGFHFIHKYFPINLAIVPLISNNWIEFAWNNNARWFPLLSVRFSIFSLIFPQKLWSVRRTFCRLKMIWLGKLRRWWMSPEPPNLTENNTHTHTHTISHWRLLLLCDQQTKLINSLKSKPQNSRHLAQLAKRARWRAFHITRTVNLSEPILLHQTEPGRWERLPNHFHDEIDVKQKIVNYRRCCQAAATRTNYWRFCFASRWILCPSASSICNYSCYSIWFSLSFYFFSVGLLVGWSLFELLQKENVAHRERDETKKCRARGDDEREHKH